MKNIPQIDAEKGKKLLQKEAIYRETNRQVNNPETSVGNKARGV